MRVHLHNFKKFQRSNFIAFLNADLLDKFEMEILKDT